jgi:Cof subfamily protein (haloacid dehalogenase superfamily)
LEAQKILALDLDGTVLDDHNQIGKDTVLSLQRASQNHATICFVTGRCDFDIVPLLPFFPLADFVILNNGTKIIDAKSGITISQQYIKNSDSKKVINFCLQNHYLLHVKAGLFWGVNIVDDSVKRFSKSLQRSPTVYEEVTESLIHHVDGFSITTETACQAVEDLFVNEKMDLYTLNSEPDYYDVLRTDVSKWNGICAVASRFNIAKENIIAVGNYSNDIDMIRRAGIGVAVQNALDEVKLISDYVTSHDNNHNAIGEVVDRFICAGPS